MKRGDNGVLWRVFHPSRIACFTERGEEVVKAERCLGDLRSSRREGRRFLDEEGVEKLSETEFLRARGDDKRAQRGGETRGAELHGEGLFA